MNITIPSNATTQSIKTAYPVPRGATHFRFTEPRRKPVIDAIKNLDTLAGCSGKLEYGKVTFEGRGRHAKIKAFTALGVASVPAPQHEPEQALPAATVTIHEANRPPVVIAQTGFPEKSTTAGSARKNKILGFSACAVAKALGKAGVKYAEADKIFRAHEIEMPKASLSVQLGFGRNAASWERHGSPAELSDAQIAELRAMAAQ